jgi:hypothetical protein
MWPKNTKYGVKMSDIDKNYVLVLNSVWSVIGYTSIKKAMTSMFSTSNGNDMAAVALDLSYPLNAEGYVDFSLPSVAVPRGIPEWLDLPVRDFDIPIVTSHKVIRAPIILMTKNFSKPIFKKLKPTKRNLYDFYKGKSIWTGKTLSFNEMTIEHLIPKSHNGDNSWKNLAPAEKDINNKRGNTPLKDFSYKPQYQLKEPKSIPVSACIKKAIRPEWQYFLLNKQYDNSTIR